MRGASERVRRDGGNEERAGNVSSVPESSGTPAG